MIFKKLTLQNFKSHINTEIEFDKGTTIVLGDNGAGKSSIFEGINFALYKKYNTKSLNDLINTKADSMTVTLSFLVGNKEYKVKRTRSQKKSTADLFVLVENHYNNIISGDREVNDYIEELLQIDADLFLNAIYIKQGEIDSLVTQKASDRKKNISKLLRLENLEISYKNIANVISNYELKRNQINSLIDNEFQENKDDLIHKQQSLKEQLDDKNNELNLLQKQIKDVQEKISVENTKNVQYQQLYNKKTQIETKAASLSSDIENIEKQIQDFKKSEKLIRSLEDDINNIDLIKELLNIYDKQNEYLQEIQNLEQEINNDISEISFINDIANVYKIDDVLQIEKYNHQKIDELADIINQDGLETKKAIHNIQKQNENLVVKISSLKTIIQDSKENLNTIKTSEGICPLCQSNLDDEHRVKLTLFYENIIQDNENKLEKRTKEWQVLVEEQKTLNKMLEDKLDFLNKIQNAKFSVQIIEEKIHKKTRKNLELFDINNKIDDIFNTLQIEKCDKNILQNIYQDLLNKQTQYQEAKLYLKNKQNIEEKYESVKVQYHDTITDLEEIDNKIEFLCFDNNLLQQYQQEQSDLQNKYYPLVRAVGEFENSIKYNQIQIDTIDEKIKQNKENKKKVKKLDNFIQFLKEIREIYSKDGLQKDIRLSFKPQIERYTQQFFNNFDFDYTGLRLSEDYDIVITGPSGDSDISMVSGGEKIAIALSLRLGIAQSVTANTIETILLDEPTTYLDELRKQEFVNIIQDISLVPQMILITHDPELENAADNIIMVEKRNGESVIV